MPFRILVLLCLAVAAAAQADTRLKPETERAFNEYQERVEARLRAEVASPQRFLALQSRPDAREVEARLKAGEVIYDRITPAAANGKELQVPGGIIHHWRGTVFVPGATVEQTLRLLQDYNNHHKVYAPEVMQSRLLSQNGDEFRAFLRFYKKKVIAVVLNTEHHSRYTRPDPVRAYSISRSTRITEVEKAGTPQEREKPVGNDNGFLWRLNSYWRMHERDGGVFIECEAITLTRDIPTGVGWIVKPFVTSIPRESLAATLEGTRRALQTSKRATR